MPAEEEVRDIWRVVVGSHQLAALEQLLGRHREPHRRYHTIDHVAAVVRAVHALTTDGTPVDDLAAVLFAALFHDAVYDPHASAAVNERASAALAARHAANLGWPPERVAHVVTMVEATAGHLQPASPEDAPTAGPQIDADTAVLLDADLAVLGAEPADYTAYANGVRAEYAHLDDRAWRTGRVAVLRNLLAHQPLYRTAQGRARFERRARANLTAELAALGGD